MAEVDSKVHRGIVTTMADHMADIYSKVRNGDSLSDDDLRSGYIHFRQMADLLMKSGEAFRLPAVEAHRVANVLQEYSASRNKR